MTPEERAAWLQDHALAEEALQWRRETPGMVPTAPEVKRFRRWRRALGLWGELVLGPVGKDG